MYEYDTNGFRLEHMVSHMADVVPSRPRLKLHTTIGKIPQKKLLQK